MGEFYLLIICGERVCVSQIGVFFVAALGNQLITCYSIVRWLEGFGHMLSILNFIGLCKRRLWMSCGVGSGS